MILEVAELNVLPEKQSEFEENFSAAQEIICSMKGYQWHQLQKCLEVQNKYLLLVSWQTLEDHTVGFRQSEQYQKWKKLLHHFYHPFPTVEHYQLIAGKSIGFVAEQPGQEFNA
ncbi:antibiotic biosynthesis monooxygenase family protein [Rufibacter roseus]|uniref:Antibiotic biosynthesis monooxygenase family protein n=1 Tax=Rufibacter roseus TaxID=1567108 RepID=A0ABW2DI23_9BACT|nr:antibiotic biosynthesis monooxygenase [Rufibacter roseus]